MKILWLSNRVFSEHDYGVTGTWLGSLADCLARSGEVELANIGLGSASEFTRQDFGPIKQWVIPAVSKLNRDGLPGTCVVSDIIRAVEEVDPDIVHVWGTESFWGLLTARKILARRAVLETQGLKFAIAKSYNGNLTFREQISCAGLKELIRGTTAHHIRKKFEEWGRFEEEMISGHRFITVQTDWLEAQVLQYSGTAHIFRNDFMLRELFYLATPWHFSGAPTIFCSAAYPAAFKGLHVAVRAAAVLKKQIPSIQLRIAGAHQRKGYRQDGYIAWVNREITRLGIEENVTWLGSLPPAQIITELLNCSAVVIPSFIEGYCLGMAEAMMVGTPAVASFSGGIPCIANDGETALFFPPGDEIMCAWQLARILTDKGLAERLSHKARAIALARNNPQTVVNNQIDIYRQIMKEPSENTTLLR